MTRIVLIRHGETDLNREKVFRGHLDAPLNENGILQADRLAVRLEGLKIDSIYSSPLSRARETAARVAAPRGLPVGIVNGLTDISYGDWEGISESDVRKRYPQLLHQWHTQPHRVKFPGGESLADVRRRAAKQLRRLVIENQGKAFLLCCHRVVNKVLLCVMLGKTNSFFWNIRQDNCCANFVSCGANGYVIELVNATSHLQGLNALEADI